MTMLYVFLSLSQHISFMITIQLLLFFRIMPKHKSHQATLDRKQHNNAKRSKSSEPPTNKFNHFMALKPLNLYTSDHSLPVYHDIGKMKYICCSCKAYMWKQEIHVGTLDKTATFSTCCMQGKISLPVIQDPPEQLKLLLLSDTPEAKDFRTNIRAYNSSLAFASLGVTEDVLPTRGPYVFRICGSVYHRIGHLYPDDGCSPKFTQLYIHDSDNELANRLKWNHQLNSSVMSVLQDMLHKCNPFIDSFRQASDIMSKSDTDVSLVLKADTTKDRRRYNLPTSSEISIIMPGCSVSQPSHRDIVLYKRSENHPNGYKTMHINETHPKYDSLHYVLLLPYGQDGWTLDISTNDKHPSKVSPMQFYAYHLMQRANFNLLHRSGRLFHQYIVDQYAKIEQERLNYCLFHQNELRADLYQGLKDAVSAGDVSGATVGKKIILPSSFIGSPRNMHELYNDAMAIVRRYGKPDLFITFTCNPKWPEILDSLLSNQTPVDRPDLTTRVFHQKLQLLLHDITQKHVFGVPLAFIYVIEFQKRGLPHCHILLILQHTSKPASPDDYDAYVSAEIPDVNISPGLHSIVVQHMIHGPCGLANPNSPCMLDNKCTKDFPKQFNEKTIQMSDGYPLYRRPDNGIYVEKNGASLDNRWVVPYNPYLCAKYQAHINVEICSS